LHGILTICPKELEDGEILIESDQGGRRQGACNAPLRRSHRSLGDVIAGFKASSTRRITVVTNGECARIWQRGYYDRVVRNGEEFQEIAEYIVTNPERWGSDNEDGVT